LFQGIVKQRGDHSRRQHQFSGRELDVTSCVRGVLFDGGLHADTAVFEVAEVVRQRDPDGVAFPALLDLKILLAKSYLQTHYIDDK
jgi:hypothetical protein